MDKIKEVVSTSLAIIGFIFFCIFFSAGVITVHEYVSKNGPEIVESFK